jgi:putative ABC transport system permease protein
MLNLKLGMTLGWYQIRQSNFWASFLIVTVVVFTLLNLVVISGILGGIIDGVLKTVREEVVGDILIEPLPNEKYVIETDRILQELQKIEEVEGYTPRYEELAIIEAGYHDRSLTDERDVIAVNILGVDPQLESETLRIPSLVTEGEYFSPDDRAYILLGKYTIDRYGIEYGDVFDSLKGVYPGDKVKIYPPASTEGVEFTVKGIIHSKMDVVALSVFIPELDLRRMFGRTTRDADQIIVKLKSESDAEEVKELLEKQGIASLGTIEVFKNNIPKFIRDVTTTFERLSLVIGSISVIVASITVFIIIFITILSRRRQIGILKAIGIKERVVEYAYATQATFYACTGIAIGTIIIYAVLVPYLSIHPIDFPYTFVFLSVTPQSLFYQSFLLFGIMFLAGLIPAKMITRQPTLESILGKR